MIGLPHILTVQDVAGGIEALAGKLTGDASSWRSITALNGLAPPYLTLDPVQAMGTPQDTETLASAVSAGATSIPLTAPASLWKSGDGVALAYASSECIVSEKGTVASYDGSVLTLRAPLANSYPMGAEILSFPVVVLDPATILMPGDILYLPLSAGRSAVFTQGGDSTDVFGSDIAAPLAFAGGDIATVSGPATLAQRIRAVLQTDVGSLPLHPRWGSRVSQSVGTVDGTTEVAAWVRQAILALPEVSDVTGVLVTRAGDSVTVTAVVVAATTGATLALVDEPLTSPVFS